MGKRGSGKPGTPDDRWRIVLGTRTAGIGRRLGRTGPVDQINQTDLTNLTNLTNLTDQQSGRCACAA